MKKCATEAAPAVGESEPLKIRSCGLLFVLSAFLLPLKWGTLAAMPEAAGFFPEEWIDYWHITWTAHSFGVWSGILLLLALVTTGGASGRTTFRRFLFPQNT